MKHHYSYLLINIFPIIIRIAKAVYYKLILGGFGIQSVIVKPLKLNGKRNIYIGNSVIVEYKTWLAAVPHTGDRAELIIKDGVNIGHFNHIYATRSIIIEENVLFADKVYVSDNQHGYVDVDIPILKQPIRQTRTVRIGEGSWIGENVCIIGASIGRHCVIGANSVVTHDVPDYCVAVGSPAIVIKRYDTNSKEWITLKSRKV